MNLLKQNAWQLMRFGLLGQLTIIVLAISFNFIWFFQEYDPTSSRYIKHYILMTCLPALIFGNLLGIGLAKFKRHPLWFNNKDYRFGIINAGFSLSIIFVIVFNSVITASSELALISIIYSLCFAIMGFLVNTAKSLPANISRSLICAAFLLLLMFELTFQIAQIALVLVTAWFVWLAYQNPSYYEKSSKLSNCDNQEIVIVWNVKLASWLSKFKASYSKDILWTISYPQTRLGIIAIYLSSLYVLVIGFGDQKLITLFLSIVLVASQLPIYQEFSQLKHQLKALAHSFGSAQLLMQSIVRGLDKLVLLNALIISLIFTCAYLVLGKSEHLAALYLAIIASTLLFLSYAPLLIKFYTGHFSIKNALILILVFALSLGLLASLLFTNNYIEPYAIFSLVIIVAALIRWRCKKYILQQPLEAILS